MDVTLSGLTFSSVKATSTVLGTTKGGWVYSGQRPSYEAKTPSFFVMNRPLTHRQVAKAMGAASGQEHDETPMDSLTSLDLSELASHLMGQEAFQAFVDAHEGAWEIRALTQAEWHAARNQQAIELSSGMTERLADAPSSNNRGAMMDGRPRPNELMGPAASQVGAIAVHPRQPKITAMTGVPQDRPLPNVVARLALTPVREGPPKRVPEHIDRWKNLRSELIWTTLLGIIPSFLIPVLRGMGDYATEGWVNLLFGGLCAGFFTGAIWRPRRPMLQFDDVP